MPALESHHNRNSTPSSPVPQQIKEASDEATEWWYSNSLSAFSFLQWFETVYWTSDRASGSWKNVPLISKVSLPEQVWEETEEEPGNQTSYGRLLIKTEEFSIINIQPTAVWLSLSTGRFPKVHGTICHWSHPGPLNYQFFSVSILPHLCVHAQI